jgi:hypothetical protein
MTDIYDVGTVLEVGDGIAQGVRPVQSPGR